MKPIRPPPSLGEKGEYAFGAIVDPALRLMMSIDGLRRSLPC